MQNHWVLAPQNSGTQVNVGTLIPFFEFQKYVDWYFEDTFIATLYRVLLPPTEKTKPQILSSFSLTELFFTRSTLFCFLK